MKLNLCVFGDSIAKGVVLDEALQRYKFIDRSFVNLLAESTDSTVENFAKFGCTVDKGERILQTCDEDLSRFDYVVLEFGGNDCDFNWAEVSDKPDVPHSCKTPLVKFETLYTNMVKTVRDIGGKPVIMTLPPIDAKRYFDWISRKLNPDNIKKWLGDIEYIARWQELFNMSVIKVAAKNAVPVVDIRSAFLRLPNMADYLCADGIHPNERGHQLICGTLLEQIPV